VTTQDVLGTLTRIMLRSCVDLSANLHFLHLGCRSTFLELAVIFDIVVLNWSCLWPFLLLFHTFCTSKLSCGDQDIIRGVQTSSISYISDSEEIVHLARLAS
jgi:hypothetical protein